MGLDLFGTSFTVAAAVCDLDLSMEQRALLTAMPLIGNLPLFKNLRIYLATQYKIKR